MKNKFIVQVVLLIAILVSANISYAQDSRKVIAVINKADWCPVCQANGEKMMKEVMPVFSESMVQFIMNDLTSESTKADSKMKLEEAKVYAAVKKINSTGWMLLIDAETGKLLEKISVAEPAEKLLMAVKKLSTLEKM